MCCVEDEKQKKKQKKKKKKKKKPKINLVVGVEKKGKSIPKKVAGAKNLFDKRILGSSFYFSKKRKKKRSRKKKKKIKERFSF